MRVKEVRVTYICDVCLAEFTHQSDRNIVIGNYIHCINNKCRLFGRRDDK